MQTGDDHSFGHMVPFNLGLAYGLFVEKILFLSVSLDAFSILMFMTSSLQQRISKNILDLLPHFRIKFIDNDFYKLLKYSRGEVKLYSTVFKFLSN